MRALLLSLPSLLACLPAAPANAQDTSEKSKALVLLHVFDDETGAAIEQFRVLPGTPYTETGVDDVAVWQPHLTRESVGGRYEWPQERTYATFRLRVEANGYRPAMTAWLHKSAGPQKVTVRLRGDSRLKGRVLTPDGKPAAGASLGIALPNRTLRLQGRAIAGAGEPPAEKLSDRWRQPFTVEAGADGRFQIPSESDPSALLVVVHESGYLQRPVTELAGEDADQTAEHQLQLAGWGQITGRMMQGERPAHDERVELIVSRELHYPDMVGMMASAQTDAEGHFAFEDVPPGQVQISRIVPEAEKVGLTQYQFPVMHADVRPGDPTEVVLGRAGPAVVGRLTGLDFYEGVTLRVHPRAPHIGFPGDEAQWRGFAALQKSPLGKIVFRDLVGVDADGSFRIEGLIPESYQLIVNESGKGLRGGASFHLKPTAEGNDAKPQDIGEIRVTRAMQ